MYSYAERRNIKSILTSHVFKPNMDWFAVQLGKLGYTERGQVQSNRIFFHDPVNNRFMVVGFKLNSDGYAELLKLAHETNHPGLVTVHDFVTMKQHNMYYAVVQSYTAVMSGAVHWLSTMANGIIDGLLQNRDVEASKEMYLELISLDLVAQRDKYTLEDYAVLVPETVDVVDALYELYKVARVKNLDVWVSYHSMVEHTNKIVLGDALYTRSITSYSVHDLADDLFEEVLA